MMQNRLVAALFAGFFASVAAADPAAPFPKAQPGETRWRIQLPAMADESQLKVELIPGKTTLVDCNVHRLTGELQEESLQGWGYTYYRLKSKGETVTTLMACPDQPREERFVTGAPLILPYNSRLPIMVYTQDGLEIRYRIWRAGNTRTATKD